MKEMTSSAFHTLTKERQLRTQVSQTDVQIQIPAQSTTVWDKSNLMQPQFRICILG